MGGTPTLSDAEAEVLEAMLARLIPSDENGPGAKEARVARFVERALAREPRPLRNDYLRNLASLDRWARAEHGQRFSQLAAEHQDTVLSELERGTATGFSPSADVFFELVRLQAIQGMFADPSHGGNAGYAGWDLLGFPGIKVVFTAADQRLDAVVEPVRPDGG